MRIFVFYLRRLYNDKITVNVLVESLIPPKTAREHLKNEGSWLADNRQPLLLEKEDNVDVVRVLFICYEATAYPNFGKAADRLFHEVNGLQEAVPYRSTILVALGNIPLAHFVKRAGVPAERKHLPLGPYVNQFGNQSSTSIPLKRRELSPS